MACDTETMLEISVVLRHDGSSYLTSVYHSGIPPAALPTMLRGALAAAILKIPEKADDFKSMETLPGRTDFQ